MTLTKVRKSERLEKQKIRHTISEALDTHCKNCPKFNTSDNTTFKYCHTFCPTGQKLKAANDALLEYDNIHVGWTEELDYYVAHHYGRTDIVRIAKQVGHAPEDVRKRFKHLQTITEFSVGRTHHAIRSGLFS